MKTVKHLYLLLLIALLGGIAVKVGIIPTFTVEAATEVENPYISNDGYEGVYYEITIDAGKGCKIYYTIDGTDPNYKSKLYVSPVVLEAGKKYTVKAVAYRGKQKSKVVTEIFNEKLNQLGKAVKKIIKENIVSDMTDLEKITAILLYFRNNVVYDLHSRYCYSAIGSLVYGHAVCMGYSSGFDVLMKVIGIPCMCVTGDLGSSEGPGHAWNMVQIEGNWYMLDPLGGPVLLSDEELKKDGYRWNEEEYPKCPQNYGSTIKELNVSQSMMKIISDFYIDFDNVEKVVIEKGVETIVPYAFENCTKLKTVEIADTVVEIGDYAFKDCSSLTNISIPDSIKMIGCEAITGTLWLKNQKSDFVIVGDGILIGDNLLDYSRVEIPDTVKIISGAFKDNEALGEVLIPNSVTKIVNEAFRFSSLSSIVIPDSVTLIGYRAFSACESLKNVHLSSNLKELGNQAFLGCDYLKRIELPEGLESIGNNVFNYCYFLEEVSIPKSVTYISDAFYKTAWMVNYPSDFIIVGDSILLSYIGKESTVTVPDGVKSIAPNAFLFNKNKEVKIILPKSLLRISTCAFCNDISLEEVNIPEGVTYIGESAFSGTSIKEITIPSSVKTIGMDAFAQCENLLKVTIEEGVVNIEECAFWDSGVTEISVPQSVKKIGKAVFPVKEIRSDLKVYCYKNNLVYEYASKYSAEIILR